MKNCYVIPESAIHCIKIESMIIETTPKLSFVGSDTKLHQHIKCFYVNKFWFSNKTLLCRFNVKDLICFQKLDNNSCILQFKILIEYNEPCLNLFLCLSQANCCRTLFNHMPNGSLNFFLVLHFYYFHVQIEINMIAALFVTQESESVDYLDYT